MATANSDELPLMLHEEVSEAASGTLESACWPRLPRARRRQRRFRLFLRFDHCYLRDFGRLTQRIFNPFTAAGNASRLAHASRNVPTPPFHGAFEFHQTYFLVWNGLPLVM